MIKTFARTVRSRYREAVGTQARLRPIRHTLPLIRLGSEYGGWTLVDDPALHGSTIISAGLGEDASFDIVFAERYAAKVVMVDPTPRAIAYFKTLRGPFTLCAKALWNKTERLKFFAPPNPAHVSHSIVNFQSGYVQDTEHIEVDAITPRDLIAAYGLPPLLKLDIEGAEIEVIIDMMRSDIFPGQVLIEYDEIPFPSRRSRERVSQAHAALLGAGYDLIHFDYPSNFLYVR